MKKGCLIKSLFVSTIVLAVVFYVITNKFDEYISVPFKNIIVKYSLGHVQDRLALVPESAEKDTVIASLKKYILDLKSKNEFSFDSIGGVADSLSEIISDKIITPEECKNFEKYLNEVIKNERRKKNRD